MTGKQKRQPFQTGAFSRMAGRLIAVILEKAYRATPPSTTAHINCLSAREGKCSKVVLRPLPDCSNHSASAVAAGGRIYSLSDDGQTTVIAAGSSFEILGRNPWVSEFKLRWRFRRCTFSFGLRTLAQCKTGVRGALFERGRRCDHWHDAVFFSRGVRHAGLTKVFVTVRVSAFGDGLTPCLRLRGCESAAG